MVSGQLTERIPAAGAFLSQHSDMARSGDLGEGLLRDRGSFPLLRQVPEKGQRLVLIRGSSRH